MSDVIKKCPKCGSDKLRAYENVSVDVVFTEEGHIEAGFDQVHEGIDIASVYCGWCGDNVDVFPVE